MKLFEEILELLDPEINENSEYQQSPEIDADKNSTNDTESVKMPEKSTRNTRNM